MLLLYYLFASHSTERDIIILIGRVVYKKKEQNRTSRSKWRLEPAMLPSLSPGTVLWSHRLAVIAADTISFVIPGAAAGKERHFKINPSTIKHQIQLKSAFYGGGGSYFDTELGYRSCYSDEPQTVVRFSALQVIYLFSKASRLSWGPPLAPSSMRKLDVKVRQSVLPDRPCVCCL